MEQGCYYDAKDNVIYLNLAYYGAKNMSRDESMQELIALIKKLPQKAYLAVNWEGITSDAMELEQYSQSAGAVQQYFKGVVRYGLTAPQLRIKMRVEAIKHELLAGMYATKEEALAAIREGKIT